MNTTPPPHRTRRAYPTLALIGAVSLLSACGQSLTQADRAAIRTVSIDRDVAVAAEPLYQGPAHTWAAPLSPIGALIAVAAAQTPTATMKATVARNGLDLGALAADEFRRQATANRVFPKIVDSGGDYKIRLEVTSWGLVQDGIFSAKYRPVLTITGRMARRDGSLAWEKQYWVTQLNRETNAADFEAMMSNPDLLRAVFTRANEVVIRGLIEDLRAG